MIGAPSDRIILAVAFVWLGGSGLVVAAAWRRVTERDRARRVLRTRRFSEYFGGFGARIAE